MRCIGLFCPKVTGQEEGTTTSELCVTRLGWKVAFPIFTHLVWAKASQLRAVITPCGLASRTPSLTRHCLQEPQPRGQVLCLPLTKQRGCTCHSSQSKVGAPLQLHVVFLGLPGYRLGGKGGTGQQHEAAGVGGCIVFRFSVAWNSRFLFRAACVHSRGA